MRSRLVGASKESYPQQDAALLRAPLWLWPGTAICSTATGRWFLRW